MFLSKLQRSLDIAEIEKRNRDKQFQMVILFIGSILSVVAEWRPIR